jgi:hypothetical protein
VGDITGGLERANGGAASEAGSDESENFPRPRPVSGPRARRRIGLLKVVDRAGLGRGG